MRNTSLMVNADHITKAHSIKVRDLAIKFAKFLGLSNEEIETLKVGAEVHDIGKIVDEIKCLVVSTNIFGPEEFRTMKKHTVYGANILKKGHYSDDICAIAHQHHEKWNGTGYPQGLRGNDINYYAQIICICDVYDALLSKRSYKQAWLEKDVQKEMYNMRGTHFNPELFDQFAKCFF